MKRFVELFADIDQTTATNAKVEAIVRYLHDAEPADAAWGVFFLAGRRHKRLVSYADLRRWAAEASELPRWLFDETHAVVGDLAETVSLLLARGDSAGNASLAEWVEARILPLRGMERSEQRAIIESWWASHDRAAVLVLMKMLTGGLRVGVSRPLVIRALAEHFNVPRETMARRFQGEFEPSSSWFESLGDDTAHDGVAPLPFFLASPIDGDASDLAERLGQRSDWLVEDKWDGIRAQAVRTAGGVMLWSRGEEPVEHSFPELITALARLPEGVVLDGELLAHDGERVLPFATLQRRLGRDAPSERIQQRYPVAFMAYDVLADGERDLTDAPIEARRRLLEGLVETLASDRVLLSPIVAAPDWPALDAHRATSRERSVEGLMLKRLGSPYRAGRVRGDWYKWKIEPHTLDLVLTFAQPGRGRRANLLTDYTFAAWSGDPDAESSELVTLAKAYSGLDQREIAELDRWIRQHTTERFGPVRRVDPMHVFELAFEGVQESDRHRSGLALRFPRIIRWRTDLSIRDADTLASARELLPQDSGARRDSDDQPTLFD